MYFTDNPIADYARYDEEQQEYFGKLPRCSECGEPIQDTEAYYINDIWICEECMLGYKQKVAPYIE